VSERTWLGLAWFGDDGSPYRSLDRTLRTLIRGFFGTVVPVLSDDRYHGVHPTAPDRHEPTQPRDPIGAWTHREARAFGRFARLNLSRSDSPLLSDLKLGG
jgi:hypothetical protein